MPTTTSHDEPLTVIGIPGHGAEDVLVDPDRGTGHGRVYTGTEDGMIWAVDVAEDPTRSVVTRVADTGGRPLGLELLGDGRLLVCDAQRGLLAVDPSDGSVETLLADVEGRPMRFCNNAAVTAAGTIYFSDSSTKHPIEEWKADLVENTRTGRLIRRDTDGTVEVLLDRLGFANGVGLAADESCVYVAQTAARTVERLCLTGARAGQRDTFAEALPGYPDNIALGSDGLLWVSIASPVDAALSVLHHAPVVVRRLITRLPDALLPQPQRTARVLGFNEAGRVVHDRSGAAAGFHMVTGVRESGGRCWLGSLEEAAIAFFEVT